MSRPLKYDSQFTGLIQSNGRKKQKNFILYSIKSSKYCFLQDMQFTKFNKNLFNIWFILCFCNSILLFQIIVFNRECINNFFFCFVSLNISNSFNKKYSNYYYYWRLAITILIPLVEFFDYSLNSNCYYSFMCNRGMFYIFTSIGLIHFYLCRIS
jgi:hypothetical protein